MLILHSDNHVFAVSKPAGVPTQAPPHCDSAEAWAKRHLAAAFNKPGRVYLGVPHRLDRPVSGVVLFARNSKAAARLAEQFAGRAVSKVYWAVLEGEPTADVWEDWLVKLDGRARVEVAEANQQGAKAARTGVRVLRPVAGGTLVELHPETGRMHQLRVQAAARGTPIRGDALYGATHPWAGDAIALHARGLTVKHPLSYTPLTLVAPLPDVWRENGAAGGFGDWSPRPRFGGEG